MSETLLPPNATLLERAASIAGTFNVAVPTRTLMNPWTCPAELLPWLAWAMHVVDWYEDWPELTKRRQIAASVQLHRKKGTAAAVKDSLDIIGVKSELHQWFQYDGAPYHFRVAVDVPNDGLDEERLRRIDQAIALWKNSRSHLDTIDITVRVNGMDNRPSVTFDGEVCQVMPKVISSMVGSGDNKRVHVCHGGEVVDVTPLVITTIARNGAHHTAVIHHTVETTSIFPRQA